MVKQLDHEAARGRRDDGVRYTLFHANRTFDELAYHEELLAIEDAGRFDFVLRALGEPAHGRRPRGPAPGRRAAATTCCATSSGMPLRRRRSCGRPRRAAATWRRHGAALERAVQPGAARATSPRGAARAAATRPTTVILTCGNPSSMADIKRIAERERDPLREGRLEAGPPARPDAPRPARPRMKVLVRYHEIALKGGNRPFFVEQARRRTCGAPPPTWAGKVQVAGRPARGRRCPTTCPGSAVRERHGARSSASRTSRAPTRRRRDLEALEGGGRGARCAAGASAPSACTTTPLVQGASRMNSGEIDRELGARRSTQATGVRVDLERAGADRLRRGAAATASSISFEKQPGPGRLPGRQLGPGDGAALGRHRLAGGGLAPDEARLHGGARPLPRLPAAGPHHHRQGARAGAHPHPLPVPHPAAARPLRRRCSRRSWPPARRRCAWSSTAASWCASRRPWPRASGPRRWSPGESLGQVASQTLDNMAVIDEAARGPDPAAAGGDGQGGDHARGAAHRHLRDQHAARPGLLPALRAAEPGHRGHAWTRCARPRRPSTWPGWSRRRSRRRRRSGSSSRPRRYNPPHPGSR